MKRKNDFQSGNSYYQFKKENQFVLKFFSSKVVLTKYNDLGVFTIEKLTMDRLINTMNNMLASIAKRCGNLRIHNPFHRGFGKVECFLKISPSTTFSTKDGDSITNLEKNPMCLGKQYSTLITVVVTGVAIDRDETMLLPTVKVEEVLFLNRFKNYFDIELLNEINGNKVEEEKIEAKRARTDDLKINDKKPDCHHVQMPEYIAKKKCCVNVQASFKKSFLYAILSVINYHDISHNRQRPQQYSQYMNQLVINKSFLPMKIRNISEFEELNPALAINVIKYKLLTDEEITSYYNESNIDTDYLKHPCFKIVYRSQHCKTSAMVDEKIKFVNLLLLDNGIYFGITDVNRLFNYHRGYGFPMQKRGFTCNACLSTFRFESTLQTHKCSYASVKADIGMVMTPSVLKNVENVDYMLEEPSTDVDSAEVQVGDGHLDTDRFIM